MRIRFTEKQFLALTYLFLFLLFLRAQQVTGPYEESLRLRVGQVGGAPAMAVK